MHVAITPIACLLGLAAGLSSCTTGGFSPRRRCVLRLVTVHGYTHSILDRKTNRETGKSKISLDLLKNKRFSSCGLTTAVTIPTSTSSHHNPTSHFHFRPGYPHRAAHCCLASLPRLGTLPASPTSPPTRHLPLAKTQRIKKNHAN